MTSGVVHASVVGRRDGRASFDQPFAWGRYLVGAALALVLIGLALFFDRAVPLGPYLPIALYLCGLVLLSGTGGLYAWRSALAPRRAPASRRAEPVASPFPTVARDDPRPARRLRLALLHGGGEWRVPSVPHRSGGGNWLAWLGPEHRRLDPESAGFAFSGGYSVGPPGGLVPIPVRRSGWTPPAEPPSRPVVAATTGGLGHSVWEVDERTAFPDSAPDPRPASFSDATREFTDEELDRLFPPFLDRRIRFLPGAPMRIGLPEVNPSEVSPPKEHPLGASEWAKPETAPPPESGSDEAEDSGPLFEPSAPQMEEPRIVPRESGIEATARWGGLSPLEVEDLRREAMNPVPPHLRVGFPTTQLDLHEPDRRPTGPPGARSVCASCSKVVVNLRLSGPCPECLRPICTDCLREGLRRYGRGWCEDCAQDVRLGAG